MPSEKTAGRHTQLSANRMRDFFYRIEPSLSAPARIGRCPRHHVELTMHLSLNKPISYKSTQVACYLATLAVPKREHDFASPSCERHCGDDAVCLPLRRRADQGESTGPTDGQAGCVASCTASFEEHDAIMSEHCHKVRQCRSD